MSDRRANASRKRPLCVEDDGPGDSSSEAEVEQLEDIDGRIFKDPVHGSVILNQVLTAIVDTPQFQRLRDIKQLGAAYWVYPGACHNRFDHSIGTAYLCSTMIHCLRRRHPSLISDKDVLCVEIAGLCHDLGHGPFSHVFDTQFKKLVHPESNWSHEQGSIDLFQYMYDQNRPVQEAFCNYGIGETERSLIKHLIMGRDPEKEDIEEEYSDKGKVMKKWFLYEIVSNKRTGVDCDKFDYLLRDCHYTGIKSSFDCMRYFQMTRIMPVDGQLQICVRDKECFNLYELFHTRWSLHHRVYQHKTTKIIEAMITEALQKVNETFGIFACTNDMARYTYLTDSVINQICTSSSEEDAVLSAKEIITRIHTRNLYKCCGEVKVAPVNHDSDPQPEDGVVQKGESQIAKEIAEIDTQLSPDDIIVQFVEISCGKRQQNPIDLMIFFTKHGQLKEIKRKHISDLLPQKFHEKYIRVCCKDVSQKDLVSGSFKSWIKKNKLELPHILSGDMQGYLTPTKKEGELCTNERELSREKKVCRQLYQK